MTCRFSVRKAELLAGCEVKGELFDGVRDRLRQFVHPFAELLLRSEQKSHVREYIEGLLSDLETKNAESIAYLHGLDRKAMQRFIGESRWDHESLLDELARQVAAHIGEEDGVIVFDPSAHSKKGTDSVGVGKQWSGRVGQTTNCQVGIYMAYASRKEHALVDERLFLTETWAADEKRREKCGVPEAIEHKTRQDLALDMLRTRGKLLPHGWVTGDDEMGHPSRFRRDLTGMAERYLMAVPSNMLIRDLEAPRLLNHETGRMMQRPFEPMRDWVTFVPADKWTQIRVRDGDNGPIVVECLKCRVRAKNERRTPGPEELMFAMRERVGDTTVIQFYLSNAAPETPLEELARVGKAEHRVEECFQRAKSEVGMSDYETRTWRGWHHHHALVFMALWFLTVQTSRGKKGDAGDHRGAGAEGYRRAVA